MFLAFQFHLNGLQRPARSHQELRQLAVRYVCRRWERFQPFLLHPHTMDTFATPEEYQRHVGRPGVYGDHVLLHALCRLFGVAAYVAAVDPLGEPTPTPPIVINAHPGRPVLGFRFVPECHYEALAWIHDPPG
jgi:hypothetical protein